MGQLPFVEQALAYRLESGCAWRGVRYAEAYQKLHPEARCASLEIAGGYAVFVSPNSPVNKVCGLGFRRPVTAEDFDRIEEFYASRGGHGKVHASPLADDSLFALLRARGYQVGGFFSMLARQVSADFRPSPLPDDLRVAPAAAHEAGLWLTVTGQGFDEQEAPSPDTMDILGPNFHAGDSLAFLAWVNDQPAGGGGMYYNRAHRVYELGGASTHPAFRRRGVQRALIEARMAAALELGCDLAMVLTDPGSRSQRNLQRAGFELAYTIPRMERPRG